MGSVMTVDKNRNKEWRDVAGFLHRDDGPAVVRADGSKEWWRNGMPHRIDGPAIVRADGSKEWWRNGERHRDDGPAVEEANGDKMWYRNGKLHREGGPAKEKEYVKCWHVNGEFHRDDGPAVEGKWGDKLWYSHDKLHREDGPAVVREDETESWYLNNKQYEKSKYYTKIKKLIIKKIGLEIAKMFNFNERNSWKRMETRALSDFLEEEGDVKTANQVRSLIEFAYKKPNPSIVSRFP